MITEEGLEEAMEMNVRKGSMDEADEEGEGEDVIKLKVRGSHGHKPKMIRMSSHNHGLGVHKEGRPMLGEIRGQKSMKSLGQLHHHHESRRWVAKRSEPKEEIWYHRLASLSATQF